MKSQLLTYNKSIRKLLNDLIKPKISMFLHIIGGKRERDRQRQSLQWH